ncbi:reverse transcriptase domain-containing protein [Tanacetum coccineum]
MSFELKNVGATYQRLVDKAFQKQIGQNLEVYVDDLVIKSRTEKEVIRDIEEMFKTLREINMKLNPKKCAFEMREGTFLGYKVDADGLSVCPDKVESVLNLPSPKCLKDVQKLNRKLASLNRFLSKSAEKSLLFFKTLKKFELEEHDIHYRPRMSVKGQILTDFIIERPKDDTLDTPMDDREEISDPWVLFTDGSSCIDGSGAGLIFMNSEGMKFTYALRFRFNATNNETEYEALIAGLRIAGQMRVQNLQAHVDSKLIANQPFYKWGTDIAGPFLEGPSKVKFLIVAIDYFTNWIEAKPMATITGAQVKKFIWDNVAPRTMIKSSNGETPFSLTYGAKAVIPVEIGMPTLRTAKVDMIKNNEALGINLDLLEERREHAAIHEARSKAKMEKYYNVRVRSTSFRPRDLLYRNNEASHAKDGGKLGPK